MKYFAWIAFIAMVIASWSSPIDYPGLLCLGFTSCFFYLIHLGTLIKDRT